MTMKTWVSKFGRAAVAVVCAAAAFAIITPRIMPAAAEQAAVATDKTLYDRIGGYKGVAATVDDLVDRIYVNGTLNKNPILKSIHDQNERAAFKLVLATWVMEATGGPKVYFGRTMKEAHAPLKISTLEFDVILHECKETFYKFAVPAKEMGELMAALESLRKDIVTN